MSHSEATVGRIVVEGLIKRFGALAALDGITFSVAAGEILGVIGPDGAGKTTLLRTMAGLLAADAGRVEFVGRGAPDGRGAADGLGIGFVSQGFSLYPDLTVAENVSFLARVHGVSAGEAGERARRLLAWVGLDAFTGRLAAHLSGGMKQKLSLVAALVHRPEVLLLDEPTTGVDPIARRELWRLVKELAGEGTAVVISTPYLDEAATCDRVALLYRGRLLAVGTPEAVKAAAYGAAAASDGATRSSAGPGAAQTMEDAYVALVEAGDMGVGTGDGGASARAEAPEASPAIPALGPRMSVGPVAIETDGLTRRFGGFVAVREVSLTVERGRILGLLGPNGSGKTTFIRMLCGLLPPHDGKVTVLGMNPLAEPVRLREQIGYMSQRFSLYRDLTAAENLDFFGRTYGLGRGEAGARREALLRWAGLAEHRDRLVGTLATGWRQQLAFACAVVHRPALLLLDEPTSGIDPLSRRRFWRLLRDMAGEGTTILVTTHYMDEAAHCDALGILLEGRLVATGAPWEIRSRFGDPEKVSLEQAFFELAGPGRDI